MAITIDEILARGRGTATGPAIAAAIPAIDSSMQGAPTTLPGSGTSEDKTKTTGTPVQTATVPPAISPDIAGSPKAGPVVTSPATTAEPQKTTPEGKKKLSYVEMFQQMSPYKPPTPEELEKERKKQKREAIFAAIGEGISAMSNLYHTTQYAPNAFDPSEGMAATTKKRFDQLKREREDNQRQYMEGFMRAMRLDAEDERDDRNWQHTLEREKLTDRYKEAADARAQAKADRDAAMAQLRMELMEGRINQQEAAARAKKIEADYADAYWQSRINKNNYRRPIGSGSRGGGGGKPGEYPWYDSDGNLHYARSYEAMRQNALNNGTWEEGTQQSTTQQEQKDRRGNFKGSANTVTTKPAKGHSTKPKSNKKWSNASKIRY